MPICYCYTSLLASTIPQGFEERFSKHIFEVFPNKPETKISVIVIPGARICKGGSTDKAMIVQIHSIGTFKPDSNPGYCQRFVEFLTTEIKIPENRFTIELVDIQAENAMSGKESNNRMKLVFQQI